MMSFAGKNVVVLGATGVVGSGASKKFVDAGATVVAVSRSSEKLSALADQLKLSGSEQLKFATGDFDSEAAAAKTTQRIEEALAGAPIDHVVSSLGFVKVVDQGVTQTPTSDLKEALDSGFFNTYFAAKALLPRIKDRDGASYTIVSGGFAHFPPPMPGLWLGTVKNAAVNGLVYALAGETSDSPVRVNGICIHMGIAPIGGDKNQLGMNAEKDTLALAPAFLAVASGTQKGEVVCIHDWGTVEQLASGS